MLKACWDSLRAAKRTALIPYLTAGFPDRGTSLEALRAMEAHGADIVELGIPFSDPLADGPTIQAATQRALAGGMTVAGTLQLVQDAGLSIPVIAFGYLNPVLQYGVTRFVADAAEAGVAGVLLTDLPLGEAPDLERELRSGGVSVIPLVAPTTSEARLAAVLPDGQGFVYIIARLGVTGPKTTLGPDVHALVGRVRDHTTLPVALGFGIADREQAAAAAAIADGVVVGSALVHRLEDGVGAAGALVAELRAAIDARR